MKRTTSALALGISATVATSIAFAGLAFAAPSGTPGPNGAPTRAASASQAPASDSLRLGLTYLREEERLARDVYAALAAKYDGAQPFATITVAEQRHFDAVGVLLSRYGIADPSAGLAAGTYADKTLQALYDQLMKQGSASLQDAYDVGVAIEKADIADLEKALAEGGPADVTRVLANLERASGMHLKAFEAAKAGTPLPMTAGGGVLAGNGPRWASGDDRPGDDRPGDGTGQGMGRPGRGRNGS